MGEQEAVRQGVESAFSWAAQKACETFDCMLVEQMRPSVLFRPRLAIDGDQWCALYGEDLQDGVAGFGHSPEEATRDFDRNWTAKLEANDA